MLGPVLTLGCRQALIQVDQTRVNDSVTLGDAEVDRPALGRFHSTDGIRAHDAPTRLGAVPIEHALVEPHLGRPEVAAEHPQEQRHALRVGSLRLSGDS